MGVDCDVAIAGAGAAGSLLALAWQQAFPSQSVVLVDRLADPLLDRRWAVWGCAPQLTGLPISATWDKLAIWANHGVSADRYSVVDPSPFQYALVRGSDLARMLMVSGVKQMQAEVRQIGTNRDAVRLSTSTGALRTKWAFDSRPTQEDSANLVMRFCGAEVSSAGAFRSGEALFMDFRIRHRQRVQFGYVLPLSADRAVVDVVSFVDPGQVVDMKPVFYDYLQGPLKLREWRLAQWEQGQVPLGGYTHSPNGQRVTAIGQPAGLIKSSTGFGFMRMYRDAGQLVNSYRRSGHPIRPSTSQHYRLLDRVFCNVAREDPNQIERALASLFAQNMGGQVLRFLDENSKLVDDVKLIRSMPKAPFLAAVARLLAAEVS